jgi:hypothetical protein
LAELWQMQTPGALHRGTFTYRLRVCLVG